MCAVVASACERPADDLAPSSAWLMRHDAVANANKMSDDASLEFWEPADLLATRLLTSLGAGASR